MYRLGRKFAAIAMLVIANGPAHSTTITRNFYSYLGQHGSYIATIDPFDRTYGRLDAALVNYNVSGTLGGFLYAPEASSVKVFANGYGEVDFYGDLGVASDSVEISGVTYSPGPVARYLSVRANGERRVQFTGTSVRAFLGSSPVPVIPYGRISAWASGDAGAVSFDQDGEASFAVSGSVTYIASYVPESSTWATLATGFGLFGSLARRRRAQGMRPLPTV